MKELIKKALKARFPYTPLVRVEISAENLLHNFNEFKKLTPGGLAAPVLKSNAYGHGLSLVAKIVDTEKPPFIIVDSYFEALAVRAAGATSPLLILGYTPVETMVTNKLKGISFTVISFDALEKLNSVKKNITIHLKIDTGMSRHGILFSQIPAAIERLQKMSDKITLQGISSHFADADSSDGTFTLSQIEKWNKAVDIFKKEFPTLAYWHTSATSGHFYSKKIKANLSRVGLGLYGINVGGPIDSLTNLKPALEIKTVISGIKKIPKGQKVGYSITFTAPKDMTIATLPLGYFEGVDRRLSSKGFVKISTINASGGRGTEHFAPIIGRVSMNITTIDVTHLPGLKIDDEVIVISSKPADKNSVENIAKLCGTIPYEILVHIQTSLHRAVVK